VSQDQGQEHKIHCTSNDSIQNMSQVLCSNETWVNLEWPW